MPVLCDAHKPWSAFCRSILYSIFRAGIGEMEFAKSGDQDFAMVGVRFNGIRVFPVRYELIITTFLCNSRDAVDCFEAEQRTGLGCLIYADGIYPWCQWAHHEGRVRHREGLGVPAFSVELMRSLDSGEGSRARYKIIGFR